MGSCDDGDVMVRWGPGPGAGWARLELGRAGLGSHRMNNHDNEGKILLNSSNNGVADFLRSRHGHDIDIRRFSVRIESTLFMQAF